MVIHQGGLSWVCVLLSVSSPFCVFAAVSVLWKMPWIFLVFCGFCCILFLVYFFGCVFSVGVFCVAVPSGLDDLSCILVGFSVCIPHQRMSSHLRRNLLVGVSVPVSILHGLLRQGIGISHCQRKMHCHRVSMRVISGLCLCLLGSFCVCGFSFLWRACRTGKRR